MKKAVHKYNNFARPLTNKFFMGTYRQVFYHIVYATKHRKPTITPAHETDLYRYINGIIQNKKGKLYRINGMEDHIHLFSDLQPSISLSDYVKTIKTATSVWMKECGLFPAFEGWQEGYGAFTYSIREKDMVINYVKNQKEQHKTESFADEFKRLLTENGVPFDEKYLI